MIPEFILKNMEDFAKADTYQGATYETIMTLIKEVRRLKNTYEPEVSECNFDINESNTDEYNSPWEVCKKCKYWKHKNNTGTNNKDTVKETKK